MPTTTSVYTLINGGAKRKITFKGTKITDGVIEVSLEAEGPNGGTWNYVIKKNESKDFNNQTGAFILRGKLSFPAPHTAIIFTGDLVLINWAQVHMDGCPILEGPF